MKKYSKLYAFSFLSYTAILLVKLAAVESGRVPPPKLIRQLDHIFSCLFLICCVYQLIYIFFLRKKDTISFGRTVARLFQYALISLWLCITIYMLWGAIFGRELTVNGDLFGPTKMYYGFDVWINDPFGSLFFWVITIVTGIYNLAYNTISKKLNDKDK